MGMYSTELRFIDGMPGGPLGDAAVDNLVFIRRSRRESEGEGYDSPFIAAVLTDLNYGVGRQGRRTSTRC